MVVVLREVHAEDYLESVHRLWPYSTVVCQAAPHAASRPAHELPAQSLHVSNCTYPPPNQASAVE